MRILMATSEAVPFCKTGGLGDVCGSLPKALRRRGHEVAIVVPGFRSVRKAGQEVVDTTITFEVPVGQKQVAGKLLRSTLPDCDVPVYFIDCAAYFDRDELYGVDGKEFADNCERFVFFNRAVVELLRAGHLHADIVHAHDWTVGLIPAYLRTEYADDPKLESLGTVFTIHNLAYQGNFWHWDMELTGIDWRHFNWKEMEFFGNLSFLKSGIALADQVTTVSPRYAQEILTPPLSCGMEGILQFRQDEVLGIVNGVDYKNWDPATDICLQSDGYDNYDTNTWKDGKARCKAALQRELGLPVDATKPLAGLVGRLVEQKGIDLIIDVLKGDGGPADMQWAILGTGQPEYHDALELLVRQFSGRISLRLEFSDSLAHRIEAGADMFLMPSRFEPCGLNQLYSLKYGTPPIVRNTGGLADTVIDATPRSLSDGTATGIVFSEANVAELRGALTRACKMFADSATWQQLVDHGMSQDWSWDRSAAAYEELYRQTLRKHEEALVLH